MRAERLTRKSHFRRINLQDTDVGTDVIDQQYGDGDKFWSLADLAEDALGCDLEELYRQTPSFLHRYDALLWATQMIHQSPTARMLLDAAAHNGWSVSFSDLKNQGFCMDQEERIIYVDHFCLDASALGKSAFFRHIMLTTLVRALRDAWHEDRLGAIHGLYSPEQVLMVERVRAADCDTVTILCGWELRGAGFTEVWRHLLGSEEGDMAIIFTRFLERDPGALFSGAALAYAFRQWYADVSRVDGVDHDALEALDSLLEDADDTSPFGQKRLDASGIEAISFLPDGKCYLAGLGGGIMRDPFFAGLNDEINQTHMFQLMYDMEVVMVNNVPFRDSKLARKIFPQSEIIQVR